MDEAGLNIIGSNPDLASRTSSGVLNITSGDGIASLVIVDKDGNSIDVKGATAAVPVTVLGENGTLTITFVGGKYHYSYELTVNSTDHTTVDSKASDNVKNDFTVTVTDNDGDSAQATLSIAIFDDMPVAQDDFFTGNKIADVSGNVLDGSGSIGGQADVFGADGKGGDVTLVTGSLTGGDETRLTFNADGTFTYTPDATDADEVKFQYQITDGDGDTSTAWVTITLNAVPSALTPDTVTTPEDTIFTGNVLTNDTNPGKVVSFEVEGTPYLVGETAVIAGVGSLTFDVDGLGGYTFDPYPDYSGPVPQVTYTTDAGLSSTLTISVTPVADTPLVAIELGTPVPSAPLVIDAANSFTNPGDLSTRKIVPILNPDFEMTARNADGTEGHFGTGFGGFGVGWYNDNRDAGNLWGGDGDRMEIGYDPVLDASDKLTVTFNVPVASATVALTMLHTSEHALVTAYDKDGNEVFTTGALKGLGDSIDTIFTVAATDGKAIHRIEFTTPGIASFNPNGSVSASDDYYIKSITYQKMDVMPIDSITVALQDTDGSEHVSGIVVAVPDGILLSVGEDLGGGLWKLPAANEGNYVYALDGIGNVSITGLEMWIPPGFSDPVTIKVTATVTDSATIDGATVTDYVNGYASVLIGTDGDDTLVGSPGNDIMTGGTGADTFVWNLGDQGVPGAPMVDKVMDFNAAPFAGGGDRLDLKDLLQGENQAGGTGNLTDYLHFTESGGHTTIHISTSGGFSGGYNAALVDQQIILQNTTLTGLDDQAIIQNLLTNGKLVTDV